MLEMSIICTNGFEYSFSLLNTNKSFKILLKCSKWINNHDMTMSITHANYRPWTIVTVTLLTEHSVWQRWDESVSDAICLSIKAGFIGRGGSTISLLSMETTLDTVGRSWANSCTHNSPTWMHLKISISKQGSYIIASINAIALFVFHNFHA